MSVCPSCGHENQPGAKFCSECGTSFAAGSAEARQERKVVTALFADLVGFTSRAEQMDPEDVRAMLTPYYERLRASLERYGGTVEKFIGDAVMALFGAPTAHEDDPERAVRAALEICEWVAADDRLAVRIGVNTGEALVTLGARPSQGEGMAAGDVVNTAARLQAAAPVNGVLVGAATHRATQHAIDYAEMTPIEAKGKSEPVAAWQATQARSRLGVDVPIEAKTELIGRERELEIATQALARMLAERSTQLLTFIGVPGIGKSRLLYELSQRVDASPELITWRQGRSLPYGEGISFWALAEMVKAQAGVLESDDAETARAKLQEMAGALLPADEQEWVLRHVRALLGIDIDSAGSEQPAEAAAAWRRLFEAIADNRPLVLVFEDLHWADDGMLDFVDNLVDRAGDVPLLVVCSARPELLERRPGWGGGKPNAATISLSPLSDADTLRLLKSLLGGDAEAASADLVAQAGGNPLYAEQFSRMLTERGDRPVGGLPESIQGIVGARLDALSVDEKMLLQDAAVVGKVFWTGTVAAIAGGADAFTLEETLHLLERKQFVRRDRRTSVAGETQFAFVHVLLRDVAYQQIPRAARASKHILAARWIESLGRPEDNAEMVAHHYLEALALARHTGEDVSAIAPTARTAIAAAGDRAAALNAFAVAVGFYRAALELWPAEARGERAQLLYRLARTLANAGDADRAAALELARDELLAVGDVARAASIEGRLADVCWLDGDRTAADLHADRSYELVGPLPPSEEKVEVLARYVRIGFFAGRYDAETAAAALEMARDLDLHERLSELLVTTGTARLIGGDREGRLDVQRGLELALAGNYLWAAQRGQTNLAAFAMHDGDIPAALAHTLESRGIALRLGARDSMRWTHANMVEGLLYDGQWDRAMEMADAAIDDSEASAPHYLDAAVRTWRSLIRAARGDVDGAVADVRSAVETARQVKDAQIVTQTLAVSAFVLADCGEAEEANALFTEMLSEWTSRQEWPVVVEAAMTAAALGRVEEARRWVDALHDYPWRSVAIELLGGDAAAAGRRVDEMGARHVAAITRLYGVRHGLVQGDRRVELQRATEFYTSVGASRYLRMCESLLGE